MNDNLTKPKAVGLISGGLDSALGAKIMIMLKIDVYGVYFEMPWACGDAHKSRAIAKELNFPLEVIPLKEDYLEVVKNPKHGYGSALNPCMDCHIFMLKKAKEYMLSIGAEFIFTGEVLGQRPMSQMRQYLAVVEQESELEDYLLRPLCAHLLKPTIPEKKGLVNRDQLYGISGRSRKEQMRLAEKFELQNYLTPAGGCLLTDKHFAEKTKDVFKYGYRNLNEIMALKWGRHFRLNDDFKAIVGRNLNENELLLQSADKSDWVFEPKGFIGPICLLKGEMPTDEIKGICAGLVQHFSKQKESYPQETVFYKLNDKNQKTILAKKLMREDIKKYWIN